MNNSFINDIREKYINNNLESAHRINYTELTEENKVVKVLYKDLPHTEVKGYPIASDFVNAEGKTFSIEDYENLSEAEKDGLELRYYFLPVSHELYVGTTGSGKTTGCVEPQLRAISSQKNKPNVFLTDPKGELFNRNAMHLKEQGYEIYVLNFKDITRSDKWNPLFELYDLKIKVRDIGKNIIMRTGKVDNNLKKTDSDEAYSETGYIEYNKMAFANGEKCDQYCAFERDIIEAKIEGIINQFANMMIKVQSNHDKSWELGAQELLKGLLVCMLEDAIDPRTGFKREMMNFRTLQQYYIALKTPIIRNDTTLAEHELMRNKSRRPIELMSTALANAGNTMKSYCGVFDGAIMNWFQGHIFALTNDDTININNIGDKPFAIFLITRDYEKSDFLIAGLFIDWIYRQIIEKFERGESSRTLHFLLDEFGNIPEIKDLENKIATSRSRNIWFHLFVQSYKQIDIIYNPERSVVIRDNCNAQVFLGAQNRQTKEIFSNECGKHFIPTLESMIHVNNYSLTEVPLIPVSSLDLIKPGQMFNKRLYMPVITSQFIRSYICADKGIYKHYHNPQGLDSCTPIRFEPFTSEKYTYAKLQKSYRNTYEDW